MAKLGITGDIVHAVAVRYRAKGTGELKTRLINMGDDIASTRTSDLDDIELNVKSNREKTVIANFQDQGIQIHFRTIFINEVFNISKIVCFVKPVAESYPTRRGG